MKKITMNFLMSIGYGIGMAICAAAGYLYVRLWQKLNS